MIDILLILGKQPNKPFESITISKKFKINGIDVSLVPDGTKLKSKVYDFFIRLPYVYY